MHAYWGPYCVSKARLDALVRTYAAETATTAVRAMLVNPGPLRTNMRRAAMPGEDPLTLKTPGRARPAHREARAPSWTRDRGRSTISRRAGGVMVPGAPA
jgi:NAD(P)-dependent dehydrogenase (short-subunit alcohol dehydrogenase family)